MHFKNQDFRIVLGKSGLEALDSILDRVFNFTTELHEKNERFTFLNKKTTKSSSTIQPDIFPLGFQRPSEHGFINVLNSNSHDIPSSYKNIDLDNISYVKNSGPSRRRPILTNKDAPYYYDPVTRTLKTNSFQEESQLPSFFHAKYSETNDKKVITESPINVKPLKKWKGQQRSNTGKSLPVKKMYSKSNDSTAHIANTPKSFFSSGKQTTVYSENDLALLTDVSR